MKTPPHWTSILYITANTLGISQERLTDLIGTPEDNETAIYRLWALLEMAERGMPVGELLVGIDWGQEMLCFDRPVVISAYMPYLEAESWV